MVAIMNERKYKSEKAYLLPLKELDKKHVFWFDEITAKKDLETPQGRPLQNETMQLITDEQLKFDTGMKIQIDTENKPRIITNVDPRVRRQKQMGRTIKEYIITTT